MEARESDATAEQLAADGHWNGDEVEGAHERLFDRVEHIRALRGIVLEDAIRVVYDELDLQRWQADLSIYRRWRASLLRTPGVAKAISFPEFRVWMETGQFGGRTPANPRGLKLRSPQRIAAFGELMALIEAGVADGAMPSHVIGQLFNEAASSTVDAPNAVRQLMQTALGRSPVMVPGLPAIHGLPSIVTIAGWYRKHRGGAVDGRVVEPSAKPARKWVSRRSRWVAQARRLIDEYPGVAPGEIHAELMLCWQDTWGKAPSRRKFVAAMKVDFTDG